MLRLYERNVSKMNIFARFIKFLAWRTGKFERFYFRICQPSSLECGDYFRHREKFHFIGQCFRINSDCVVTDPKYVRVGNNVTLSSCTLLGHDGSVAILSEVYGKPLDSVGKVDIRDNCFVGHGAIVMPRVTIGPNSIVAAGAVVTRDVAPGVVVGGNPARVICTTDELVARLEARCNEYPWMELIRQRKGAFDPALEPELVRQRVAWFYPEDDS